MELYIKNDFILKGLKDYGFKHVKNEKKEPNNFCRWVRAWGS